jgi:hypothetical protein
VAEIYSQTSEKPISPGLVKKHIKDFSLSYKTVKGKLRQEIVWNKKKLKKAIEQAEQVLLSGLGELYEKVAEIYNKDTGSDVHKNFVAKAIKEFKLSYKTEKGKIGKGKQAIEVDKQKLIDAILESEKQTIVSLTELYKKTTEIYNSHSSIPISVNMTTRKIKEWGLKFKEPKGRKPQEIDEKVLAEILARVRATSRLKSIKLYKKVADQYSDETNKRIRICDVAKKALELGFVKKREKKTEEEVLVVKSRYDIPTTSDFEANKHWKSCGCGYKNVVAPAGECPSKLKDTTEESVREWMQKVIDNGHLKKLHYSSTALRYFASKLYDRNSEEYMDVDYNINNIVREIL